VFDEDGSFVRDGRFHADFMEPVGFGECDTEAQDELYGLLSTHAQKSSSKLAATMLEQWPGRVGGFVRMTAKPQG
jgi:glutamate synthase (NADPH/NADH) large chain